MFNDFLKKFSHDLGIDLGTKNTLVYVSDKGIVINEPSVVAINKRTNEILEVGEAARKMVGKTPGHIETIKPLVDGIISDFEVTEKMLKYFINKVNQENFTLFARPRVVIGIPLDLTEVEKKAVEDAAKSAGARKVYALDVGYGQLALKLREDKRVVVIERTNVRYYDGADLDEQIDLAVIDASFISLKIVLPAVLKLIGDKAQILALIKPQFEVAKEEVGKGGIVQDSAIHDRVVQDIGGFCKSLNLEVEGTCASPILGPAGNREFFILARKKEK